MCVDGGVQTEAVELADTLVSITDELFLIVPENYQCVRNTCISLLLLCSLHNCIFCITMCNKK